MSTKQKYRRLSYGQGILLIPIGPPAATQITTPKISTLKTPKKKSPKNPNKKSFGEKRRIRLEQRDGNMCWLCNLPFGESGPLRKTIDHVIPESLGGSKSIQNLRLAHKLCNGIRGSKDPKDPKVIEKIRAALSAYLEISTVEM
jgi:5-methylcytosine-specific restriction endonuclease McrA